MSELSRDVILYTAGVVDGEGYVGLTRKGRRSNSESYSIRLTLTNTSIDLLVWLKEHWGGNITQLRHNDPKKKPSFSWYLYGRDALFVIEIISPFLIVKRRQALQIVSLKRLIKRRSWHHPERSATYWETRKKAYEELRILNKKGPTLHGDLQPELSSKNDNSGQSLLKFPEEHIA